MASQITSYKPTGALPYELLVEVAKNIPERHAIYDCAIELRDLAAFSACSRTLRTIGQEMLFQEVLITSENQLQALMRVPPRLLQQTKQLNILMDIKFYSSWLEWASISSLQRTELAGRHPPPVSPYAALAIVLSHTSQLGTLRISVAESTGPHSPFSKLGALSIPFGAGLAHGFSHACSDSMLISLDGVRLPKLTKLQLAGFEDVEPLLQLAPNLEYLTMELAGGYSQTATVDLLGALAAVPRMRHLAYSPKRLYIDELDSAVIRKHDIPRPINMIAIIGKTFSELEVLDLRNYQQDDKISYVWSVEYLVHEHIIYSLSTLPRVHTLILPMTVVTEQDLITLRIPFTSLSQPHLSRMIMRRQTAISNIEKAELELVKQVCDVMPALRSLSFVRPKSPTGVEDSCVTYRLEKKLKSPIPNVTSVPPLVPRILAPIPTPRLLVSPLTAFPVIVPRRVSPSTPLLVDPNHLSLS
ncbi:hypothetical protein DL93DRAFT_2172882 [Clavulina sp. PMI_390]|nr:hypothetical protein DL93DRAFT_2172882 [Clavulina sp. PMI_390]